MRGIPDRITVLILVLLPAFGPACRSALVIPVAEKQRGVSWVAGAEVTAGDLQPLVEHGIGWIVQTPFGWQTAVDAPEIHLVTEGRVLWGERDEGLITTTNLARAAGVRTLLKPHVWLRSRSGAWRSDIAMTSEADWAAWFDQYRRFILHYAELAEANGIEILCVGTELHRTAVEREADWRAVIAAVREVYHGKLTYAANWYREYEEIRFWDALDFIGIQAYFPLADHERPSLDTLLAGWIPHRERIEVLVARVGKPVIFTEVGYRSAPDAAIHPWEWLDHDEVVEADPETQARCYEAFFRTFWDREWCAGAYWWKWFPDQERFHGGGEADFTPQGKPAAAVIARWYRASIDGRSPGP